MRATELTLRRGWERRAWPVGETLEELIVWPDGEVDDYLCLLTAASDGTIDLSSLSLLVDEYDRGSVETRFGILQVTWHPPGEVGEYGELFEATW